MEFLLESEMGKKERDQRVFKRKLVRLAKYVDLKGGIDHIGQFTEALITEHKKKDNECASPKAFKQIIGKRKKRI